MNRKAILIVDDNPKNVKLVRDVLAFKGYLPLVAESGEAAVAMACQHRPDLILMDVQLPGISGTEAMKRIKADAQLRSVPSIALTALAMKGAREDLLAEGFDGYLSKPLDLHQLLDLIKNTLE